MPSSDRVLNTRNRQAGTTTSRSIVTGLKATPVDAGAPRWRDPDTSVYVRMDVDDIPANATLVFDVVLEATAEAEGGEGWYVLLAAEGMKALATAKDGSPLAPQAGFRSTAVNAVQLRLRVTSNQAARFGARIEVE